MDVEFIVGKPVNNAKLNPLLEVGYVYKEIVFCGLRVHFQCFIPARWFYY